MERSTLNGVLINSILFLDWRSSFLLYEQRWLNYFDYLATTKDNLDNLTYRIYAINLGSASQSCITIAVSHSVESFNILGETHGIPFVSEITGFIGTHFKIVLL